MKNKEIASIFTRIADALEIKGEIGFKVLAYRRAARILEDMTLDVESLAQENKLEDIPGIGAGIARKIEEYVKTGHMKKLDDVLSDIPEVLLELLNIQNLGGKTIHLAYEKLGIKNLKGLKKAIADGSLAGLYGLGEKRVENIKKGIEIYERSQDRIPIFQAVNIVDEVVEYLEKNPHVKRISPAGSLRRMSETVGDIDILVSGKSGDEIISHLVGHPDVTRVLAAGKTKGSMMIRSGEAERQVDLRIVDESEYGAALQYFTGSKAHNIRLRSLAKERGLKISEYGVFKGGKRVAGFDEKEIYEILGMAFVPPEMREDRGEVELALRNALPPLVELRDLKGDLHVHSGYSDGGLSLEEIAETAMERKYQYIAICDHSQSVNYANGLSPQRLLKQMDEIDRLNSRYEGFKLLKGTEVDILQDGSLDFPDDVLRELDFVVASIHSGFKKNVTERMLEAMANPMVTVIAHPSGRLISRREGYEVDLDRVIAGAAKHGTALELNAYYDRLDLNEFYLKKAKEASVVISIGTDTHHWGGMDMMRFGVGIARRAWLEKGDVLNCLSRDALIRRIKKGSGQVLNGE